jgi:inosine-uridine nucleoside N-ribohydrolase
MLPPERSVPAVTMSAAAASIPRRKVIIDQDAFGPGGSNLQSILMVLQAPDVEVLGITTVSGDGWVKENTAHALRLLELVGRTDVPVVPGATYPLVNSEEATHRWEGRFGKLPYKGAWMKTWPDYTTVHRPLYHAPDVVPPMPEGEPATLPANETAAEFLVRNVREFPGEITILAMGPFINLALAARLDERFAAAARALVFMGASFNPIASENNEFAREYLHHPRIEFNCRFDPEAASIMLRAGWRDITCVPIDATVRPMLTTGLVQRATDGGRTAAARYLGRFAKVGYPMWDEIAAAVLLDRTVATATSRLALDIATDHGAGYGATLSWTAGGGPGLGEPDVTVVHAIDPAKLEELFVRLMQRSS